MAKAIAIKIDEELFRDIHIQAAKRRLSIEQYVTGLIRRDMFPERFADPNTALTPAQQAKIKDAAYAVNAGACQITETLAEAQGQTVQDHANELLVEAAARSGYAANRMVDMVLAGTEQFPNGVYRAACRKAIDNANGAMLKTLLTQAEQRMAGYTPAFWGEAAHYGYRAKGWFARQIVDWCSGEQIAAAPSVLLLDAVRQSDYPTAWKLAEGGINADSCFADIVGFCAANGRPQTAYELLRQGARVSPDNFEILHACIDHCCIELGKLLLDQGMDFERYREWSPRDLSQRKSYRAIEEHWNELQAQAQGLEQKPTDAPGMGGMTLG